MALVEAATVALPFRTLPVAMWPRNALCVLIIVPYTNARTYLLTYLLTLTGGIDFQHAGFLLVFKFQFSVYFAHGAGAPRQEFLH